MNLDVSGVRYGNFLNNFRVMQPFNGFIVGNQRSHIQNHQVAP